MTPCSPPGGKPADDRGTWHSTRGSTDYRPSLDVLRIAAVIGVIGVHVLAGPVQAGEAGLPVVALRIALTVAAPLFLMITGALTLGPGPHRAGAGAFLWRRVRRVVPALVFWSVFYLVVVLAWWSGEQLTPAALARRVIEGETYTHLWFLSTVLAIYVIAPVLSGYLSASGHVAGAHGERQRAWTVGVIWCSWAATVAALPLLTSGSAVGAITPVTPGALTFALLYGGYCVIGRAVLLTDVPRYAAIASLIAAIGLLAILTCVRWTQPPYGPEPSGMLALLAPSYLNPLVMAVSAALFLAVQGMLGSWLLEGSAASWLRSAGEATFGIYLVHFAVLVMLRELGPLGGSQPWALALLWLLTTVVSAGLVLLGRLIPVVRAVL